MDSFDQTSRKNLLDGTYWNTRYATGQTGWDLGGASPSLKAYIDQTRDVHMPVLIPGSGNSYEADYLLEKGFTNITLLDIAKIPVQKLQDRYKDNPHIRVLQQDFFEHTGCYGLILEQTFFCALPPSLRETYAGKMHSLLAMDGKLAGLLFDRTFEHDGPPFGGSKNEYYDLFAPYFYFKIFDTAYNSVPPRAGSELFFVFTPKNQKLV